MNTLTITKARIVIERDENGSHAIGAAMKHIPTREERFASEIIDPPDFGQIKRISTIHGVSVFVQRAAWDEYRYWEV
ncbi:MAG: hypothetical protein WC683_09950 [bacterium]